MISKIVGSVIGNFLWAGLLSCILIGNEQAQNIAVVFYWAVPALFVPIGVLMVFAATMNKDKEKAKRGLPMLGRFSYVLGLIKSLVTFSAIAYTGFLALAGYYLIFSIISLIILLFAYEAHKETLKG